MTDLPSQIAQVQSSLDALKAQALTPVANPLANNTVEPGYTTTEFWATIGVIVTSIAAVFHPGFSAPPALVQALGFGASGIATLGYSFARSLRKRK